MNIKTLLLFVHSHHYNSINPTIVNVFKVLELAHFVKNYFVKNHFVKNHFVKNNLVKDNLVKITFSKTKKDIKKSVVDHFVECSYSFITPRPEGRLRDWVG